MVFQLVMNSDEGGLRVTTGIKRCAASKIIDSNQPQQAFFPPGAVKGMEGGWASPHVEKGKINKMR